MKDILLEQVERHFAAAAVSEARDRVHDLLVEDGVVHHTHVPAARAVAAVLKVKLKPFAVAWERIPVLVHLVGLALAFVVRIGVHLEVPGEKIETFPPSDCRLRSFS